MLNDVEMIISQNYLMRREAIGATPASPDYILRRLISISRAAECAPPHSLISNAEARRMPPRQKCSHFSRHIFQCQPGITLEKLIPASRYSSRAAAPPTALKVRDDFMRNGHDVKADERQLMGMPTFSSCAASVSSYGVLVGVLADDYI